MKKLIFKLLFSVFSLLALNLFGQNVVTDTNNIKKPKSGGLYYQKKDKTLYLFREKFEVVNKPELFNTEYVYNESDIKENVIAENKIKFSPDEARLDILDWTKISDFKLPNGWLNIAGYGVPVTGVDVPTADGKYLAFSKGFTHYRGMLDLGLKRYNPENRFIFDHPSRLVYLATKQLMGHIEGKAFNEYPNGYVDGGVFGDVKRLLNDKICDYSGLTEEGAKLIGKYCYYQWWTQDINTQQEVWPTNAWVLMDEEQIGEMGGMGKQRFLSIINQEIKRMQPGINLGWYAAPMHYFYHSNQNAEAVSDGAIEKFHLERKGNAFDYAGFKNAGFWVDVAGYVGVPHIREHSKYERNPNGSFKLLNGNRIYAKENFFENIYGEKTEFLAEPADWIKWRVDTPEGIKVSASYFDSGGNLKPEYKAKGWSDANARKKSTWEPETKKATDGIYSLADIVLSNLLKANQLEFGDNDISRFRSNTKVNPYMELRFVTEGAGYGSNSTISRHKGKELTTWEVLFSYMSGVKAASIFGEGRGYKPDGSVSAISWGSLIHRQEAIRQLSKDLEGTDQSKWRFIHFYYPVALNNRRGVIGVGIYTGEKFIYLLSNPSLNYDENQIVGLFIDGKKNNIVINGADLYNYNVISNLKKGLDGNDFNLTYKTIYGKQIKVSGIFDGILKNTLIEEK